MIRFGTRVLIALFGFGVATVLAQESDREIPRDVLKGIDAMRQLPADGFHVVESQGRLLLVSTNGHYVVTGGRLLDLWNQLEIRSVADVEATLRLPLSRMGISTSDLGGVSVGLDAPVAAVTVFLDPASPESQKLLPQLRNLAAERRVDLVFVPARPERTNVSRALICDGDAARKFFSSSSIPAGVSGPQNCGNQELERARVTVQLLGIKNLPFSVTANGATVAGTPKDYIVFVAANQEKKQ